MSKALVQGNPGQIRSLVLQPFLHPEDMKWVGLDLQPPFTEEKGRFTLCLQVLAALGCIGPERPTAGAQVPRL